MTRPDIFSDVQIAEDEAEMVTFEKEALNVSMATVTLAQGREDWPAAEHWVKACDLLEINPRQ